MDGPTIEELSRPAGPVRARPARGAAGGDDLGDAPRRGRRIGPAWAAGALAAGIVAGLLLTRPGDAAQGPAATGGTPTPPAVTPAATPAATGPRSSPTAEPILVADASGRVWPLLDAGARPDLWPAALTAFLDVLPDAVGRLRVDLPIPSDVLDDVRVRIDGDLGLVAWWDQLGRTLQSGGIGANGLNAVESAGLLASGGVAWYAGPGFVAILRQPVGPASLVSIELRISPLTLATGFRPDPRSRAERAGCAPRTTLPSAVRTIVDGFGPPGVVTVVHCPAGTALFGGWSGWRIEHATESPDLVGLTGVLADFDAMGVRVDPLTAPVPANPEGMPWIGATTRIVGVMSLPGVGALGRLPELVALAPDADVPGRWTLAVSIADADLDAAGRFDPVPVSQ